MLYQKDDQPEQTEREFDTLTVRVTHTLRDTINQIARSNGETVSAVVRSILRSGIEQRAAK